MTTARMWEMKICLAKQEEKSNLIKEMLAERTQVIKTMGNKQFYIEFKDGSQLKSVA